MLVVFGIVVCQPESISGKIGGSTVQPNARQTNPQTMRMGFAYEA